MLLPKKMYSIFLKPKTGRVDWICSSYLTLIPTPCYGVDTSALTSDMHPSHPKKNENHLSALMCPPPDRGWRGALVMPHILCAASLLQRREPRHKGVSFHFLEMSHHPLKVKWYFPSVSAHEVAQRGGGDAEDTPPIS